MFVSWQIGHSLKFCISSYIVKSKDVLFNLLCVCDPITQILTGTLLVFAVCFHRLVFAVCFHRLVLAVCFHRLVFAVCCHRLVFAVCFHRLRYSYWSGPSAVLSFVCFHKPWTTTVKIWCCLYVETLSHNWTSWCLLSVFTNSKPLQLKFAVVCIWRPRHAIGLSGVCCLFLQTLDYYS